MNLLDQVLDKMSVVEVHRSDDKLEIGCLLTRKSIPFSLVLSIVICFGEFYNTEWKLSEKIEALS